MSGQANQGNQLEPAIIVVFGVTGDLAQRYLLPALYHLFKEQLLHEQTQIIGLTRQDMTVDELYGKVELCINEIDNLCDPVAIKAMRDHSQLLKFDPGVIADYDSLTKELAAIEKAQGVCMNRLYYLSIPPNLFEATVENLGKAGLQDGCEHGVGKARLLVEKPFGANLATAGQLITTTNEVFHEAQVFRIDHYLAKETVQNILTFRQSNPIFGSIWDGQHITAIDILASEKIGIEGRVNFYEGVGALRDLIQSHLLQLLGVTTMHMPAELTSDSIHASKQALMANIQTADPSLAVRGQYEGYRQEVSDNESMTETYAKLHLQIDNDDWRGVPITITTGKALTDKRTEVRVTFTDKRDDSEAVNVLTFRIQPDEGIDLQLRVKKPSYEHELQDAAMSFSYFQTFGDSSHPNAYERVLVDAVKGDRTLFATSEEVLQSWRIIEPVLEAWKQSNDDLKSYPSGSNGPE
jgi:glucose-6-phosphate 1-dehydrogenase